MTLVVLGAAVLLYAVQGTHMITTSVLAFAAVLLTAALLVDAVVLFGPDPR